MWLCYLIVFSMIFIVVILSDFPYQRRREIQWKCCFQKDSCRKIWYISVIIVTDHLSFMRAYLVHGLPFYVWLRQYGLKNRFSLWKIWVNDVSVQSKLRTQDVERNHFQHGSLTGNGRKYNWERQMQFTFVWLRIFL
jgi:hypothetical protein